MSEEGKSSGTLIYMYLDDNCNMGVFLKGVVV